MVALLANVNCPGSQEDIVGTTGLLQQREMQSGVNCSSPLPFHTSGCHTPVPLAPWGKVINGSRLAFLWYLLWVQSFVLWGYLRVTVVVRAFRGKVFCFSLFLWIVPMVWVPLSHAPPQDCPPGTASWSALRTVDVAHASMPSPTCAGGCEQLIISAVITEFHGLVVFSFSNAFTNSKSSPLTKLWFPISVETSPPSWLLSG